MKYLKYILFAVVIIASSYSNPLKEALPNIPAGTVEQVKEDAKSIIDKVDKNMTSDTRISTTDMIIYGKRKTRTIRSKGYARGDDESF